MKCKKYIAFGLVWSCLTFSSSGETIAELKRFDLSIEKPTTTQEVDLSDTRDYIEYEARISFYTDLACENTEHGAVNCMGEPLRKGMVANNVLELGQELWIEGIGDVTVSDRGGKAFNSETSFDVFIPRNHNESDTEYYNRVNHMGIKKVKVRIYLDEVH